MVRWLALVAVVSLLIWRYAPRIRITWFMVVTTFVVIVGTRAALQHWG